MAEETVNIQVLIEATKGAKTLGELEKGVENLNQALNKTDDVGELNKLNKALDSAGDDMVKLALATDHTTATLGELEKSVEVLTEKLKGVDRGSAEFDQLSKKLIETNRELKNVELSLEALDSEQVASELGSVAGAVGDVTSAFILMGGEGNQTLEQIASRVQTAIGVAVGFKGAIEGIQSGLKLYRNFSDQVKASTVVLKLQDTAQKILNTTQAVFSKVVGTSTVAMKGLRTALISTGIGALVIGVGLLVANFGKLSKLLGTVNVAQETFNEVKNRAVGIAGDELSAISKLQASLKDESLSRKDRNEAIEKLQATYPDLLKNIDLETASTKEVNDQIEKYNELVILRAEAEASAEVRKENFTQILRNQTEAQTGQNIGLQESAQALLENFEISDLWGGKLRDNTELLKLSKEAQQIANEGTAEENQLLERKIEVLDRLDVQRQKDIKAKELELGIDQDSKNEEKNKAEADKKKLERQKVAQQKAIENAKAEAQRIKDLAQLEEEIFQKGLVDEEDREARKLTLQFEAQRTRITELVKDDKRLKALLKINEDQFFKDLEAIEKKYSDLDDDKQKELQNKATANATELLIIEERLQLASLDNTKETETERAEIEKRLLDLRIRQINEGAQVELQATDLTADERIKIEQNALLEIANLKKEARELELTAQKEALDQSAELIAEQQEQIKGALLSLAFDLGQQIADASFEIAQANAERESEFRLSKIEETFTKENELLEGKVKAGLITQKVADREATKLEQQKNRALEREAKKVFEENKKLQIKQATINGALAFTSAVATTVPLVPLGLIAGAGVLLSTGIQIGKIKSTSFGKGGILNGPSHAQGGILTNYGELEGGEAVINKQSTAQFKSTLSKINQAGGGVSFATGGILGNETPAGAFNGAGELTGILERLNENLAKPQRSYVVESDITSTQDRVKDLENNAEL